MPHITIRVTEEEKNLYSRLRNEAEKDISKEVRAFLKRLSNKHL